MCNSELRGFQHRLSEFDARGIRVVGISVDPSDVSKRQSQKLGYTFPLLSDPDAKVIRRYDLLHPGAGPKGADIARPAEFLLDSDGIVRWVNLTDNIAVRARPQQVLDALNRPSPVGQ
ncbi:MAG TPA: peroxiredoxin family protein [Candidatus Udaeobacter sp.]|nr:peroxiredoxin family protein [Candidatus Udaeobacter sp.]